MKLTPEILDAVAHRYRTLGFEHDFRNYLTNYLVKKFEWDEIYAHVLSKQIWEAYENDGSNSIAKLWQKWGIRRQSPENAAIRKALIDLINGEQPEWLYQDFKDYFQKTTKFTL